MNGQMKSLAFGKTIGVSVAFSLTKVNEASLFCTELIVV